MTANELVTTLLQPQFEVTKLNAFVDRGNRP